jgi:hypothetical protein
MPEKWTKPKKRSADRAEFRGHTKRVDAGYAHVSVSNRRGYGDRAPGCSRSNSMPTKTVSLNEPSGTIRLFGWLRRHLAVQGSTAS